MEEGTILLVMEVIMQVDMDHLIKGDIIGTQAATIITGYIKLPGEGGDKYKELLIKTLNWDASMFILNNFYRIRIIAALSTPARVAELVDAADSKSAAFTGVLVRFQSRAH